MLWRLPDQKQLSIDYHATFESDAGRRVLKHLISQFAHFDRSTLVAGEPQMTGFNEGQRYVMCCILRQLGKRPHDLPAVVEESQYE